MTPAERDLALALVRQLAERLRAEVGLLEIILEALDAEAGEVEWFALAVAHASTAGRLVVEPGRMQ